MPAGCFLRRLIGAGALLLWCASAAAGQQGLAGVQTQVGTIIGVVTDDTGTAIARATVTLSQPTVHQILTVVTTADGQFAFSRVRPGPYGLTVSSPGFAARTVPGVLEAGEVLRLSPIRLVVAFNAVSINVRPTVVIAERQIKEAEQQRVFGVIPNYFVVYNSDAVPLTAKQKFELSRKSLLDPVDFATTGLVAAVQQARHDYSSFGGGVSGYAKRYVAFSATVLTRGMLTQVVLPSVFNQDPRYFFKGTGSKMGRAWYAIGTAVIRKGDNGHWQPNYSGILGSFATGALANLYYPAEDRRGMRLTLQYSAFGIVGSAAAHLAQEFLLHKLTTRGTPATSIPGAGAEKDSTPSGAAP